jgi:hypothetical protein
MIKYLFCQVTGISSFCRTFFVSSVIQNLQIGEKMPNLNKISTRFSDKEMLALTSSAVKVGLIDRNGKPKISTFIRLALKSNTIFKNNLISINKLTGDKNE